VIIVLKSCEYLWLLGQQTKRRCTLNWCRKSKPRDAQGEEGFWAGRVTVTAIFDTKTTVSAAQCLYVCVCHCQHKKKKKISHRHWDSLCGSSSPFLALSAGEG